LPRPAPKYRPPKKSNETPRPTGPSKDFAGLFSTALAEARRALPALLPGECRSSAGKPCTLCAGSTTAYDDEIRARNDALQAFWTALKFPLPLSPLVASPPGRHYRTVTKRKAYNGRRGVRLSLIDPTETTTAGSVDVLRCAIEPEHHAEVYSAVQDALEKPYTREFAEAIRYVVIKGNDRELTVILSVGGISSDVVRTANTLSRGLTHRCPQVTGVMLFEETGDGRYYLGSRDPSRRGSMKKIFGEALVYQKFGGKGFLFPALAFTQANASLVDRLIADARLACGPMEGRTLYDLYCGYGVFALTVGEGARQAVGIERSPEAIGAASDNARRQHARFARFLRSDISAESLAAPLGQVRPEDVVLLDPPRGGTARGVIEAIASKEPRTVIHLICNIDLLGSEIRRWTQSGYSLVSVTPYDMFPGTNEVEIMLVLQPGVSSDRLSTAAGKR
jgi:tRNA/tmRNA/rRNA uracil-C5-methylase (TrmA/RlmC/RlmD family)